MRESMRASACFSWHDGPSVVVLEEPFPSGIVGIIRTDDSDIIPHDPANFFPVMRHHHHFVGVVGVAGMPRRDAEIRRRKLLFDGPGGGAMSTNQSFEQGVTR